LSEGDQVEVLDADTCSLEAEADGLIGKVLGVPLPVEPLLLGECHDFAVAQEAGGGVMAEAIQAENRVHALSVLGRLR
jgi:hypothetical protein